MASERITGGEVFADVEGSKSPASGTVDSEAYHCRRYDLGHARQGRRVRRCGPALGSANRSQPSREWVGGRLSPPFHIHDGEEPYRPDLALWLELPEGHIVGQALVMPEDSEGAVGRALRSALTQPASGLPRQPEVIRIADAAIAAEVRAEVGDAIPVTVAPAPELDAPLEHLIATLPSDADKARSDFAWGPVSAAAVERLFAAGRLLFAVQPWTVAHDTQVLRMDIPALGVDGACVSVIGELEESRGVLVFSFLDDFEAFYCFEVRGKTVDAYLDARARRCSRKERRWLDA